MALMQNKCGIRRHHIVMIGKMRWEDSKLCWGSTACSQTYKTSILYPWRSAWPLLAAVFYWLLGNRIYCIGLLGALVHIILLSFCEQNDLSRCCDLAYETSPLGTNYSVIVLYVHTWHGRSSNHCCGMLLNNYFYHAQSSTSSLGLDLVALTADIYTLVGITESVERTRLLITPLDQILCNFTTCTWKSQSRPKLATCSAAPAHFTSERKL